ncbi:MAG: metallophosphoesterase, partial [Candidatus Omnitrophica bacterium]|nr:metallophosphoesterase [Candidatus Omnitrophota bacterium]
MKVFISDLHLGDGSRTDDFSRDRELLEFLDFIETEDAELIILGDFLELWQADLDRILFAHAKVIERLLKLNGKLTYVIGNHDYIPFIRYTELGLGVCQEYHSSSLALIAEHGHKYDIFNRYKNPLRAVQWPPGMYFTLAVAYLERFIHPDIDQWAKNAILRFDDFTQKAISLKNKVNPSSSEYVKRGGHFGEFTRAVKAHIAKGIKVVVFGHTHNAQLEAIGTGIY